MVDYRVENLTFKYPHSDEMILKNISFSVKSGESLGILGPNGGGKTTLLRCLVGLNQDFDGKLFIDNNEISVKELNQHISYVPQQLKLNPYLPLRIKEVIKQGAINSKSPRTIDEVVKIVGLEKDLNELIQECSGGERQRVFLAKALISNPKILFLDEPTQGLDSKGQDQLLELVKNIKEKHDAAVIIVDHNINQVLKHCNQILCLNKTSHWHDKKDLLNKDILESIYHCEFEHILIHHHGVEGEHVECSHDHSHDNGHGKGHKDE